MGGRRVSRAKVLRHWPSGDKAKNKMIRKIKKSVPGYMKRDRIEKVRSIHNAQDIMGLDDDKEEYALSALHEKKKKKKKSRSNTVSTESESKTNELPKPNELKFARSADSIDQKKKNNKEKPKIKQADLDAINRLLN